MHSPNDMKLIKIFFRVPFMQIVIFLRSDTTSWDQWVSTQNQIYRRINNNTS